MPVKLNRRTVLKVSALAGSGALLSSCQRVISEVTDRLGETVPCSVSVPDSQEIDSVFHLLSRAAYGPWPGDIDRIEKQGARSWIDEQLDPEKIDDRLCDLRTRRFETLYMKPGDCYEFKNNVLRDDITRYTLLKAIYSKRQLFEVMVGFWSDHLNINIEKGECIFLKAFDDQTVVRQHALGNFKELIKASALSPAMLVYLDGKENKRGSASDVPNENYGRELMELHTLGVNGGYTQKDVLEAARCLTGWKLKEKKDTFAKGTVHFDASLHDDGKKIVLGRVIPEGGQIEDIDRLIDIVVSHPATARHIARKLVRFFVSDEPPQQLVNRAAQVFTANHFEIKPVIRCILTSGEFEQSRGNKFKRPFRFLTSALRATAADTHAHHEVLEYLSRMGQGPFQYPTPDGYPDEMLPWLGTLLWRWNFALALASNQLPSVSCPLDRLATAVSGADKGGLSAALIFRYCVGRKARAEELAALRPFEGAEPGGNWNQLLGLVLSSPAFQRF